jgi:hypothetical protein
MIRILLLPQNVANLLEIFDIGHCDVIKVYFPVLFLTSLDPDLCAELYVQWKLDLYLHV